MRHVIQNKVFLLILACFAVSSCGKKEQQASEEGITMRNTSINCVITPKRELVFLAFWGNLTSETLYCPRSIKVLDPDKSSAAIQLFDVTYLQIPSGKLKDVPIFYGNCTKSTKLYVWGYKIKYSVNGKIISGREFIKTMMKYANNMKNGVLILEKDHAASSGQQR